MAKIRILYVIASSDIGGAENFVYIFLKHLNNARFEKYVVCPDKGYYVEKFRSLTKGALFINHRRSFMNPWIILRIYRFIKDNGIDIIHSMLYTSDFCVNVARLFSVGPYVLNTINGFNFLILERGRPRLKRRIASLVYRFIYRYSDKIVAVSEAVRRDLIERKGIKITPEKIERILAAGVDTTYYNFSEEDIRYFRSKYLTDKELIISAIGTLSESKDYDNMLEAFSLASSRDSRIKLFIAGDGPEKGRLQKRLYDLDLSTKVHFLGSLDRNKKNAFLYLTDIFVMSSASEGCPTSLLEAMYFEKPIVATEVGGIPEIIKHGESGLLVPPKKPEKLAEAILELAQNQKKRIRLAKEAKQIFEKCFSNRHMLKAYEDIYNNLLISRKKKMMASQCTS